MTNHNSSNVAKKFTTLWAIILLATVMTKQVVAETKKISIKMPDIRPDHPEQYLCIAHRLPVDRDGQFIVGFNPKADANRVHHMLMYGCQMPGIFQRDSPNFVWDCSEMHVAGEDNQIRSYEEGPVCKSGPQILYGWALDAPSLKLPEGVGFKVGGHDTNIHFLVLQVHYGHTKAFEQLPDLTDNSGLILDLKANDANSDITKRAGVLLLISLGHVTTGKSRHEIWCDIDEDVELHPFRYRVHTHKLGTKVLGAKMGGKNKIIGNSEQKDLIIGAGDPQKPQMFYPVKEKNITISRGDTVYAFCEFNNNGSHIVKIGPTGNDEMCNFYLMYWTSGPKLLKKSNCFGQNPNNYVSFSKFW